MIIFHILQKKKTRWYYVSDFCFTFYQWVESYIKMLSMMMIHVCVGKQFYREMVLDESARAGHTKCKEYVLQPPPKEHKKVYAWHPSEHVIIYISSVNEEVNQIKHLYFRSYCISLMVQIKVEMMDTFNTLSSYLSVF